MAAATTVNNADHNLRVLVSVMSRLTPLHSEAGMERAFTPPWLDNESTLHVRQGWRIHSSKRVVLLQHLVGTSERIE